MAVAAEIMVRQICMDMVMQAAVEEPTRRLRMYRCLRGNKLRIQLVLVRHLVLQMEIPEETRGFVTPPRIVHQSKADPLWWEQREVRGRAGSVILLQGELLQKGWVQYDIPEVLRGLAVVLITVVWVEVAQPDLMAMAETEARQDTLRQALAEEVMAEVPTAGTTFRTVLQEELHIMV